jgi:DNA gyrase subunit A
VQTIYKEASRKTGIITAARVVQEADDLTLISASGVVLRARVKDVARSGRATRGAPIMNVEGNDYVASVARTAAADLKQAEGGNRREVATQPGEEQVERGNGKP